MPQIRKDYDEIVMGIFNICVKFVTELQSNNKILREQSLGNDVISDALQEQKHLTEDYLLALNESK